MTGRTTRSEGRMPSVLTQCVGEEFAVTDAVRVGIRLKIIFSNLDAECDGA